MLKDKIIIVCGGAGLLGKAVAIEITKNNGIAIVADNNVTAAKQTTDLIQDEYTSGIVDSHFLDITSKSSIEETINYVAQKYSRIDGLINCAYPEKNNYCKRLEEVESVEFCNNISLHLGGYFLVSQRIADYFFKQGYGNVVNISSIYGVIAPRFEIYENTTMTAPVEYSMIKAALIHLSKYMAKYYKGTGIRFNCISPGGLVRDQGEVFLDNYNKFGLSKGMLDVSDVIGTAIYLLSDAAKYVNGQNIVVDDGWTL
ncbi:MAG TPA: flagellin modification protein A [Candidatus Margulisbacteria bacterium]|nr:MAG: flagellin modification protein A [Candidatus Margulisbacteria bacterium GWD2_39_127]HAR62795.1 flagellin modification protein A [Candidatus Margulisiibacteriota bacterium]